MKKELICISCPVGCHLVADNSSGEWKISGNQCPRGVVYGLSEMTDPRRIVTAVVRSNSRQTPLIPVRTDQALPIAIIPTLLNQIYSIHVAIPVQCGQKLIENVEGTGVNVIFSTDVAE